MKKPFQPLLAAQLPSQLCSQRVCQELFRRCDRNGTGAISFYEFRHLLSALSLKLTPSQTRTLFRVFDEDHTGESSSKRVFIEESP